MITKDQLDPENAVQGPSNPLNMHMGRLRPKMGTDSPKVNQCQTQDEEHPGSAERGQVLLYPFYKKETEAQKEAETY